MQLHLIRLVVFALCSTVGLLTYMALAAVVGLGTPLPWNGDSMLSMVYGLITLGVGAIPYYLIAVGVFALLRITPTLGILSVSGFVLGTIFLPILPILGSYLTDLPLWRNFDNVYQVRLGLAAVGVVGAIVAVLVVALIVMLVSPRAQSELKIKQ